MSKSSDLNIIKQLEQELGVTLKKVKIGEIDKRETLASGYWGKQAYAPDEEGRVIGLDLDFLELTNKQVRLISQLHFLEFAYSHDKRITFKTNMWDFGGQPIQYMLHQYFLTPRSHPPGIRKVKAN